MVSTRIGTTPRLRLAAVAALTLALLVCSAPLRAESVLRLFGDENVGTAGAQFLKIPAGARSASLGRAGVAAATDASGLFWNPASVMRTPGRRNLFFSHTEYAADIDVDHASYHWRRQNFGFGITAGMLRSGDILRTTELHQEGTGQTFNADMYVLGFTVSRAMTDRFSIGGTVKYYQENLDEFTARAALMDIGVLYFVGVGDMRIGFAVRNFGPDIKPDGTPPPLADGYVPASGFQSFSAPTSGSFGAAYTFDLSRKIDLLTTMDFHHPTDYSESFRFGGELGLDRRLYLRAGYETNRDDGGFAAGFGVAASRDHWSLRVDYAMRDMGVFGTIHMLSVDLSPLSRPARRSS